MKSVYSLYCFFICAADFKAVQGDQVAVSCDGSWQRRGFQSKNGVFTLLSADKEHSKVIEFDCTDM